MDDLVNRLRDLGDHASFDPSAYHEAADAIEALQARVAELEARLEIDHYFTIDEDGNFTRREATDEERLVLPDKIDCVEASLELAEEQIAELKSRVASVRAYALEEAARRLLRCFPNMGMIDEFADAIRAMKGDSQ